MHPPSSSVCILYVSMVIFERGQSWGFGEWISRYLDGLSLWGCSASTHWGVLKLVATIRRISMVRQKCTIEFRPIVVQCVRVGVFFVYWDVDGVAHLGLLWSSSCLFCSCSLFCNVLPFFHWCWSAPFEGLGVELMMFSSFILVLILCWWVKVKTLDLDLLRSAPWVVVGRSSPSCIIHCVYGAGMCRWVATFNFSRLLKYGRWCLPLCSCCQSCVRVSDWEPYI